MKKFIDKEVIKVTEKECVSFACDLCGRESLRPKDEAFDYFGDESFGYGGGEVRYHNTYYSDFDSDKAELCPECGEALVRIIKYGYVDGPSSKDKKKELLKLIGRDKIDV